MTLNEPSKSLILIFLSALSADNTVQSDLQPLTNKYANRFRALLGSAWPGFFFIHFYFLRGIIAWISTLWFEGYNP